MKLLVALSALLAVSLAEEAKVVAAPLNGYAGFPYAAAPAVTYAAATAPVAAPVAPVTYAAPIAPYVGSQFHAQDEFGNLNYGYSNLNSAKAEAGNTYGGVSGGYSYVDANGVLQQVQYVADGAGFRVADSRLPVAPVYDGVAPTFNPELPVAPMDTAEVAEAKAAFAEAYAAQEAAVAAVAERKKREADPAFSYSIGAYPYAGLGYAGYHPYAAHGYAAYHPYGYGLG